MMARDVEEGGASPRHRLPRALVPRRGARRRSGTTSSASSRSRAATSRTDSIAGRRAWWRGRRSPTG